jgi:mono/diheme cytochrome c family protein
MNAKLAPALALALVMTSGVTGDLVAAEAQPNVGKQVYDKWCAPCHAPGPDHPGTTALDALYKGSKPGALIERTDLTPPVIRQFVRKGVSVMPFFRKTEISDAELNALATFLSKAP